MLLLAGVELPHILHALKHCPAAIVYHLRFLTEVVRSAQSCALQIKIPESCLRSVSGTYLQVLFRLYSRKFAVSVELSGETFRDCSLLRTCSKPDGHSKKKTMLRAERAYLKSSPAKFRMPLDLYKSGPLSVSSSPSHLLVA